VSTASSLITAAAQFVAAQVRASITCRGVWRDLLLIAGPFGCCCVVCRVEAHCCSGCRSGETTTRCVAPRLQTLRRER
jgi:hypothetical protein